MQMSNHLLFLFTYVIASVVIVYFLTLKSAGNGTRFREKLISRFMNSQKN